MEILITENEELRLKHLDELKHDSSSFLSLGGGSGGLGGINGPLTSEMILNIQEKLKIVMDENSLLTEQKIVLTNELDKQQSTIEKQFQELSHSSLKLSDLSTQVAKLQEQVESVSEERDDAAKHALSCSNALGKGEQEIEQLTEELVLTRNKLKESEKDIIELKKQLKNVSSQYDEDGNNAIEHVKVAEERVKELHSLLLSKNQELDGTNEVLRKLRNEYSSTRNDAEGMLQVMTGMERQLNEYSTREETVNKLANESRQKMEEAILMKEGVRKADSDFFLLPSFLPPSFSLFSLFYLRLL
jgi:chromosome segregation ATPase